MHEGFLIERLLWRKPSEKWGEGGGRKEEEEGGEGEMEGGRE